MVLSKEDIINSKRILCICKGGNVRSITLSTILKMNFKKDSISCGSELNTEQTIMLLCEWADLIVLMSKTIYDNKYRIFNKFQEKIKLLDVGEDIWGYARNPDLVEKIRLCLNLSNYRTKIINDKFGKLYELI